MRNEGITPPSLDLILSIPRNPVILSKMVVLYSALNPCRATAGHMLEFFERDLTRVAAGGHQQGAMGNAEVDALLRTLAAQESVGKAGGKAVTAADTVFNLEVREVWAVVERAVVPHDGRPVVHERRRRLCCSCTSC